MNRTLQLIKNDLRQIAGDPMLAFSLLGPALLLAFARFGLPLLAEPLERIAGIQLHEADTLLLSFFILLIPLLIGMVSGFMMLDERDERLIQFFGVTPLGKYGYLRYRLLLPVLVCIVFCLMFFGFSGLTVTNWWALPIPLLLLVVEAPMLALFLLAFASNKIEGLALSKGAGIVVFAPLAAYFIPMPWQLAAGLLPTYWPAAAIQLQLSADEAPKSIMTAIYGIGILYHTFLMIYLLRRFNRMME
ncbi:hypothetical protein AB6A23_25915 [Paenibacillus tarimensis]